MKCLTPAPKRIGSMQSSTQPCRKQRRRFGAGPCWVLVTLVALAWRSLWVSRVPGRGAVTVHDVDSQRRRSPSDTQSNNAAAPKVIRLHGTHFIQDLLRGMESFSNVYCSIINNERQKYKKDAGMTLEALRTLPLTLDVSLHCRDWDAHAGRILRLLYALRLGSKVHANIGVNVTCMDANETMHDLVLPWFTGYFPPRDVEANNSYPMETIDSVSIPLFGCLETFNVNQISQLFWDMQQDVRRMAMGAVGLPDDTHPSATGAHHASTVAHDSRHSNAAVRHMIAPLLIRPVDAPRRVEWDDAVIHVPCLDWDSDDDWFRGVLKFASYSRYVSPNARSIGIVTRPWEPRDHARDADAAKDQSNRCRIVTLALVEHIHSTHPTARVTIRNDPSESSVMTYARLVMANESIGGLSSIGVWPILSTFGTGYWHEPKALSVVNAWVKTPRIDELASNVQIIEEGHDSMTVQEMRHLWETSGETGVVDWFNSEMTGHKARVVLPAPRVIRWQGVPAVEDLFRSTYMESSTFFCDIVQAERSKYASEVTDPTKPLFPLALLPLTLDVSFNCRALFVEAKDHGSGGFLRLLYTLRLGAMVHTNIGINFTCNDAEPSKHDLVIPWFTGYYPPRALGATNMAPVETLEAWTSFGCDRYDPNNIAKLHREMQYDFRRMAIGLVGIPHDTHPSATFAQWHLSTVMPLQTSEDRKSEWKPTGILQVPVDPATIPSVHPSDSIDLDDAVIHFRCGDLMDSDHASYAFLKFQSYTHYISRDARSIGILTQPFPDANGTLGQTRHVDTASSKVHDRCRIVTYAFVEHIESTHPQARVTIRNGPTETIALTYARLVMANQSIGGISTFSVLPILSTFGTAYWHEPRNFTTGNAWVLTPRFDELASNVHILEDGHDVMGVKDMRTLWETHGAAGVVAWFQGLETSH